MKTMKTMKTTKTIYLASLAALSLTACSNDNNDIFEDSAAVRLEQYKKEYAEVLTSNGGLWSMEYFSNSEEPGYVFVMKFDKNGSVTISANHKWIGGIFSQETSLWKMIADNGPVLSFNSYNNLFHIFSDPADIVGPDAPTGDFGDINETGYGHEGDYEFQVMEVSEDGNTVRLLGKKRLLDIYLHRLDANVDIADFLDRSVHVSDFVSPYFGYVNLVAADGEEFVMSDLETGIPSVYPKLGDAVTQTKSGNGIFTLEGFRFMNPLVVPRAEGSTLEPLTLNSFTFAEDGSLVSSEGDKIVGPYALDVFLNETMNYSWSVDLENCGGSISDKLGSLEAGIKEAYPKRSLESVTFGHSVYDGNLTPCISIKISGAQAAVYYISYTSKSAEGVTFDVIGSNSQALTLEKKTMALTDFANALAGQTYLVSSPDVMSPSVLTIAEKANANSFMTVNVK